MNDFDVVVIGGGPAGSTVATMVALAGHRAAIVEKQTFPRYQIGESLIPATVHGIAALLGVREEIEQAGFVKKLGGIYRWGKSETPWHVSFNAHPAFKEYGFDYAFQVERSKFDKILLDNARKKGVTVLERHAATGVIARDGRYRAVACTDESGNTRNIDARYIVDASGNESTIHKELGERVYSKFFQNIALFGYFKGGKRFPPPLQGNILSCAFSRGWFWYIPLSAELTSVGAVIAREHAGRIQRGYEQALRDFIDQCPLISDFLSKAERVTEGQYGQVRVRKDYSYTNTRFWSPGLALVGDAACFIDPVFSSGVHLATYAAMLAGRSINSYLKDEANEALYLEEFERRYRTEFNAFYDFLIGFYDMHEDETSYYWNARKVLNTEEQAHSAFIRLVSGGGTTASDFFEGRVGLGNVLAGAMSVDAASAAVEDQAARQRLESRLHNKKVGLIEEVHQLGPASAVPAFEGGLVPSTDRYHWTRAE